MERSVVAVDLSVKEAASRPYQPIRRQEVNAAGETNGQVRRKCRAYKCLRATITIIPLCFSHNYLVIAIRPCYFRWTLVLIIRADIIHHFASTILIFQSWVIGGWSERWGFGCGR